jgi:hypothetical protein
MTVNLSSEPRGVRVAMLIEAMRVKPLPRRSEDEADRLVELIRRRPLPRRSGRAR